MDVKRQIWLDWWAKYYFKGLEDPDYTLLLLKPKMAQVYYKLQKAVFNPGVD